MRAFHGGRFWEAVDHSFSKLMQEESIIRADVLDAWFDPPAQVLAGLTAAGARISPPTHAEGAEAAIELARGLPPGSVLLGPGSSALMYLVWLKLFPSRFESLLLEPSYGEYSHLTSEVAAGVPRTLSLLSSNGFRFDADMWLACLHSVPTQVAVIVNPNNPTGTSCDLTSMLDEVSDSTHVWIDEAYIDYTDLPSMEGQAASRKGVFVLKSLSKAYALSGLRAAYLVGHPDTIASLRAFVPPWWVSLPAQVAATEIWNHLPEYARRHGQTDVLRLRFSAQLEQVGFRIAGSRANWVLVEVPLGASARRIQENLAQKKIFVRHAGQTAPSLDDRYLRIAVLPEPQQGQILEALKDVG